MLPRLLTLFSAMLMAACSPLVAQEKVTLKQKFPPGKYELTENMTSLTEITAKGQKRAQDVEATKSIAVTIAKPDAQGLRKVTIAFVSLKLKWSVNGQVKINYDSAKAEDANTMTATFFKSLLEAKVTAEIASDGKLQNVSNLNKLWESMAGENPHLAAVARVMGQSLTDNMVLQVDRLYPAKPVGVGDTWKTKLEVEAPPVSSIERNLDSKLKSVESSNGVRTAVIDYVGKGGKENTGKPTENVTGAIKTKFYSMEFTQKGTMKVNLDTGVPCENEDETTSDMSMSMSGPNDDNFFPVTTKQKSRNTLKVIYRP